MRSLRKTLDDIKPVADPDGSLALRVATVRVIFACINFAVIVVDHNVPAAETGTALVRASAGAVVFFVYAAVSMLALRRKLWSVSTYELATPFLDVLFASVLIALTDGYLSPFNLWLVFAVVASGVTSWSWQPLAVTAAALLSHVVIALVPQRVPIDAGTFAVRTTFLFSFAAVVAAIGSTLARSSERLRQIEEFGQILARANALEPVLDALRDVMKVLRPTYLEVVVDGHTHVLISVNMDVPTFQHRLTGGSSLNSISIGRPHPLTETETHFVIIMGDRFASTTRRLVLATELVEAAAREERLRLADEVHDSYLQIMAAVSMHAEVAADLLKSNQQEAAEHLDQILRASREGTRKARAFVDGQYAAHPKSGPEHIQQVLRDRWSGPLEFTVDDNVRLTEGQWNATEALVKEGINNAVIHGQAKQLAFSIKREGDETRVELAADGNPPPEVVKAGYGLTRLQKIVEPNHGELTLLKNRYGGSSLTAIFAGND